MQRECGFSFALLVLLWLGVVLKERGEKSQNVEQTKEEIVMGQKGDIAGEKLRQDEGKVGQDLSVLKALISPKFLFYYGKSVVEKTSSQREECLWS